MHSYYQQGKPMKSLIIATQSLKFGIGKRQNLEKKKVIYLIELGEAYYQRRTSKMLQKIYVSLINSEKGSLLQ